MNKKIAAVAVAGLFAAPSVALAQSSVTISGVLKMGFESLSIGNYKTSADVGAGRGTNTGRNSSFGVVDDSSRIVFNVREDLGGGLAAIGQLDIRVKPDDVQGAGAPVTNSSGVASAIASGNSHVGLQSSSWGRIFFGRQDLHYFNTSGNISGKNSLRADSISLLAYAGAIGVRGATMNGGTGIAAASRTPNVVHYTTPNWGGFTGIIAFSSNPNVTASDSDIGNASAQNIRRGYAWNLNPNYAAANWQVGYSYWKAKPDAGIPGGLSITTPSATQLTGADQTAHRVYGDYTFGFGLKIGLAWDHSKMQNNNRDGSDFFSDNYTFSKRTVWSIPAQYSFMGKHQITGHYTWAKKDTGDAMEDIDAGGFGNKSKAKMWAIGYSYDLSKRTSIGLTYAKITNGANAGYNLFTSGSLGMGGATGLKAGEDPRMFGTTFRHAF